MEYWIIFFLLVVIAMLVWTLVEQKRIDKVERLALLEDRDIYVGKVSAMRQRITYQENLLDMYRGKQGNTIDIKI